MPKPLSFSVLDYFKAFFSWLYSYKTTFIIRPGLYYFGRTYDISSPLLVTCNYHLTLFLLWRKLRERSVRILVIDTKGINVWCSSGKGQFNSHEILKQIKRIPPGLLSRKQKLQVILPKLSLSGVTLSQLRENSIIPKIGPVYRQQIPAYLDDVPFKDRREDKYLFNLKDRLFTLLPTTLQFMVYSLILAGIFYIGNLFSRTGIYWQLFLINLVICILYVIFFPVLPSRKFAIKGIYLSLFLCAGLLGYHRMAHSLSLMEWIIYPVYIFAVSIGFGLYYTGNTGVSNYSLVKREIITFLPMSAILLLSSMVLNFI